MWGGGGGTSRKLIRANPIRLLEKQSGARICNRGHDHDLATIVRGASKNIVLNVLGADRKCREPTKRKKPFF